MAEFVRGGPSVSNSAKVRTVCYSSWIIHPYMYIVSLLKIKDVKEK